MNKTTALPMTALISGIFSATAIAEPGAGDWVKNTSMRGLVEVEASYADDYAGDSSSDIVIAKAKLFFDAVINERITANMVLLHEEDDTPLGIDEAMITVDLGDGLTLIAGQMFLPFGNYETNMVSDTLAHTFSENIETTLRLDYTSGAMASSFYVFNGDSVLETGADETVASMGLNIMYATDGMTAGISYTSNLTDGFLISDNLATSGVVSSYIAGMSIYATKSYDRASVFFEYISALDDFAASDLANGAAKPSAMNLEAGYSLGDAVIAIAYQASREAVDLGLPETRIMLGYSMDIMKDTSLSFEVASDSDYDLADNGTGETATSITAQLAVEF